jgi:hypothetical protein
MGYQGAGSMLELKELDKSRKLIISLLVIIILIISWTGIIDHLSREYVNASTVQALAAYGTARVINAAVSLASSISISASLGVGFDVQPFQILDPLNDLVEQYSSAMKFSISSLIVQKIIVETISTLFFKVALTLLGIAFIISTHFRDGIYSFFIFRIFAFFTMIRFLVVMVVLMNGVVEQAFVDKRIAISIQEVEVAASQIEQNKIPENGLSVDERQGLLTMREELQNEYSQLIEKLNDKETALLTSQNNIIPLENRVSELEGEMGTIEKLNVFSREDDYAQAISEKESAIIQIEKVQDEIENLATQLDSVDKNIQNATDIIEGNNVTEGWMASMTNKISEFRDMAKWERIVTTVENIIPSLLNLMAAFLFKTLIMPLVFLILFLKGFKYIWRIDPRKWAKDEYVQMKKIDS